MIPTTARRKGAAVPESRRNAAGEAGGLPTAVRQLTTDMAALTNSIDRLEATTAAATQRARRRIAGLLVAVLLLAAAAASIGGIQHRNQSEFRRVRAGLIEACQARQASDAALRAKNQQLRDDAHGLAEEMAGGPYADRLGPVITYLRQETAAYQAYLAAIPQPVNCTVRYQR